MRRIFLAFIFSLVSISAWSQTTAEKLEAGVKIYNAMKDYQDTLVSGSITQEQIQKMNAYSEQAVALFDDVLVNGTTEEKETARYFKLTSRYELGFTYGVKGEHQAAYNILKPLEGEMEYFGTAQRFPLRYKYDGKNYIIKYENFSLTRVEYYAGLAEICSKLLKNEEALRYAHKIESMPEATAWFRYLAADIAMDVKKRLNEYDREMMDLCVKQMEAYAQLDTALVRRIRENNYTSIGSLSANLLKCIERNPSLAKGEYHRGTAAPIVAKFGSALTAVEFYIAAIEGGYSGADKNYLFEAADFGKKQNSNKLIRVSCDALMKLYLTCPEYLRIADLYDEAGESAKSAQATAKSKECEKEESERKAKEEKLRKKRERAGTFKFYAGVYPLGLATRYNSYRDYGGVAGFAIKNHLFEFSYKKLNRNLEWTPDLFMHDHDYEPDNHGRLLWDGMRMHAAWYVFPKGSSDEGLFLGPSFEMVEKTFEPVWSDVIRADNNTFVAGSQRFQLHDKGYSAYFNYGFMSLEKNLMLQWFTGFGVGYYSFTVDAPYDNDTYLYSNQLMEYRKPQRFMFVARMGLTIGFYLGKK